MRLLLTSTGLFGLVAATSTHLRRGDECVQDELHDCFTRSLAQASRYCTNSIVTVSESTRTVTVTPTVTLTEAVMETATITATRERLGKRSRPHRKRGDCSPKPPACMANLPSDIQPAHFTSACSCIGITTTTQFATVTASNPETAADTQTVTDTTTVTVWAPESPEPTETSTSTTSTLEPSTAAPTPSAVVPVTNGDFETGNLDPWKISSSGVGYDVALVPSSLSTGNRGAYMLSMSTSYFIANSATTVTVSQPIVCDPGASYKISFYFSIVSSYTNGNPWSIFMGTGITIVSGPGSSVAWSSRTYIHTCRANAADNVIAFRMQSNNNRAGRMLVDNVVVEKV